MSKPTKEQQAQTTHLAKLTIQLSDMMGMFERAIETVGAASMTTDHPAIHELVSVAIEVSQRLFNATANEVSKLTEAAAKGILARAAERAEQEQSTKAGEL